MDIPTRKVSFYMNDGTSTSKTWSCIKIVLLVHCLKPVETDML